MVRDGGTTVRDPEVRDELFKASGALIMGSHRTSVGALRPDAIAPTPAPPPVLPCVQLGAAARRVVRRRSDGAVGRLKLPPHLVKTRRGEAVMERYDWS